MITPMKQLDLLLFHEEKEEFLTALRKAGVVHITESEERVSDAAREIQQKMAAVKKLMTILPKSKGVAPVVEGDGEEVLSLAFSLIDQKEGLLAQKEQLLKELALLEPWGEIAPGKIAQLAIHGIYFSFYELKKPQLELLKGLTHETIATVKGGFLVVIVSSDEDFRLEGIEPLVLPEKSLAHLKTEIAAVDTALSALEEELATVIARRALLEAYGMELQGELDFENAQSALGSKADGHLFRMHGWLAVSSTEQAEKVCDKFSCWYELSDPTADSVIPVELNNKPTPKLFEPITKIFDLPDYFELDPTPFFAPFYALFFGLCLGDLGYGFTVVVISLLALLKGPKGLNGIAKLGFILGGATMASGVLLNTVFGAQLFATTPDAGYAFLSAGSNGFALLKPVMVNGTQVFPAMSFALYLGFIQIVLGIALKGVNKFREGGFEYLLYPCGSILLTVAAMLALIQINFLDMATLFAVIQGVSSEMIPQVTATIAGGISTDVVLYMTYGGLFLLFFFNNPDKKLGMRLPLGLWELYGFVTGLMGDVLSYIRLFALGLAGGLLGKAFNDIGFMILTDGSPKALVIVTIVILIIGHTINFLLAALGSFVHPLRLTFVEFYKNLDFKGGAPAFSPFRNKDTK